MTAPRDANGQFQKKHPNGKPAKAEAKALEGEIIPPNQLQPHRLWYSLDDVKERDVACLWQPQFPIGCLTLITGNGGLGKSSILRNIVARGSVGGLAPDGGPFLDVPFDTAIMSWEDPLDFIVKPRILQAGGDPSRVLSLFDREAGSWPMLSTPEGMQAVREAIADIKNTSGRNLRFLYMDGYKDFIPGVNFNDDGQVRYVSNQVGKIAQDFELSACGLVHPTKKSNIGISGTATFRNAARSVVVAVDAPATNDKRRCLLLHCQPIGKHNWTRPGPALAYTVDGDGQVVWLPRPSKSEVDKFYGYALEDDPRDNVHQNDAREFLICLLANGPVPASDKDIGNDGAIPGIFTLGRHEGLSPYSLRRAAEGLGIVKDREGFGPGSWVQWKLPGPGMAGPIRKH